MQAVVMTMEDVQSVPRPSHLCVLTKAVLMGTTIAAVKANCGAQSGLEALENVVSALHYDQIRILTLYGYTYNRFNPFQNA